MWTPAKSFVVCISLLICLIIVDRSGHAADSSPRIAVIGAGIGGASASYYLRDLFGDDCSIDVYEPNRIGGRLAVTEIGGHFYEVGGSIIHPKNRYMVEFAEMFGLEHRSSPEGRLGLYDGREYVFVESSWSIANYFKLFWRYGSSILRMQYFIDDLLNDFSKIYKNQDEGRAFKSVKDLLSAMSPSFVNMTQVTARSYLRKQRFSDLFIDEMLTAITRVNYGQTPEINAFVGAVALAGSQPGLWAIKGGNYQMVERLLERANVNLVKSKVNEVILRNDSRFDVNSSAAGVSKTYDIVVVATPLAEGMSGIEFKRFKRTFPDAKLKYHRTVATHVRGVLNTSALNMKVQIDEVLTTTSNVSFNSLSLNRPVDDADTEFNVWKIFSQKPLADVELDALYIKRDVTLVKDWLAYPVYEPPEHLSDFVLHSKLYYTSCIELAASAMEMSLIAGRNVALFAYNDWVGKSQDNDRFVSDEENRTDL